MLYVGIDLHKRTSTWVALEEKGEAVFTRDYPVTPDGIRRGIEDMQKLDAHIHTGIEPCCGWQWVVPQLEESGMTVQLSNPRKTVAIAKSLQKTDKNDATMLAKLVRSGMMCVSMQPHAVTRDIRELVRERVFLVQTRTNVRNRLEGIVTREGRHLVPGNLATDKAQHIMRTADNKEWERTLDVIDDLTEPITELDDEIAVHAKEKIPRLLKTIPGVGDITAVSVWAEVGDFAKFSTPEKLCAYAGLVPTERSSGGVQKLGHITKAGSSVLRYVLVEAAMRIRAPKEGVYCPFHDMYTRLSPKGKIKARVAVARKMLTIMWHMVHTDTEYKPRPPQKQLPPRS
jgi:transposase